MFKVPEKSLAIYTLYALGPIEPISNLLDCHIWLSLEPKQGLLKIPDKYAYSTFILSWFFDSFNS